MALDVTKNRKTLVLHVQHGFLFQRRLQNKAFWLDEGILLFLIRECTKRSE